MSFKTTDAIVYMYHSFLIHLSADNSIETCILSSMKQITSPGWMHETSPWGWCTGIIQRDGMEREVGGGSGWGTHVNPWLVHVNVWQKTLQYYKVINLQLIKINEKKKKKDHWCLIDFLCGWSVHSCQWAVKVLVVVQSLSGVWLFLAP